MWIKRGIYYIGGTQCLTNTRLALRPTEQPMPHPSKKQGVRGVRELKPSESTFIPLAKRVRGQANSFTIVLVFTFQIKIKIESMFKLKLNSKSNDIQIKTKFK